MVRPLTVRLPATVTSPEKEPVLTYRSRHGFEDDPKSNASEEPGVIEPVTAKEPDRLTSFTRIGESIITVSLARWSWFTTTMKSFTWH